MSAGSLKARPGPDEGPFDLSFCHNDNNEKTRKGAELQEWDSAEEAASDRLEACRRLEERLIRTTVKI